MDFEVPDEQQMRVEGLKQRVAHTAYKLKQRVAHTSGTQSCTASLWYSTGVLVRGIITQGTREQIQGGTFISPTPARDFMTEDAEAEAAKQIPAAKKQIAFKDALGPA